jgi:hypothetical protein
MNMSSIKNIKSLTKDLEIQDPEYRFTYRNSAGGKLSFYKKGFEYIKDGASMFVNFSDITRVSISPYVKKSDIQKVVTVFTADGNIDLLIDTGERGTLDIFTVYRLLSRLVITSRV